MIQSIISLLVVVFVYYVCLKPIFYIFVAGMLSFIYLKWTGEYDDVINLVEKVSPFSNDRLIEYLESLVNFLQTCITSLRDTPAE